MKFFKISVISSSENGIKSRGIDFKFNMNNELQNQPQFFAVVVGIGDYANSNLNLNFPVADANAISKAIRDNF